MDTRLVGAWSLVSFTRTPADGGAPSHPYGADAQGVIVYSPDGVVSYQLCAGGRARWASGDIERGTPEELAAAAASFRSYVARWSTTGDVVSHAVFLSFHADRVGVCLQRRFSFHEGADGRAMLSLVPVGGAAGAPREELLWARVADGSGVKPVAGC